MNEELSLKELYELLIKIYKKYIDWEESNHKIISLWVLGVFYHNVFVTFPYIFVNAMKGSGKTRLEKLSAFLTHGDYTVDISEAPLFRERLPLFLDEVEDLKRKEKIILRELLNVAYKRGGVVIRMKKDEAGNHVAVKLPVYRPIMLANIEGIDDVLEDRCITMILEKSSNPEITRRVELFELDGDIKRFSEMVRKVVDKYRADIEAIYYSIAYYFSSSGKDFWNGLEKYLPQHCWEALQKSSYDLKEITRKIDMANLMGRDLELWLPLLTIASAISMDLFDEIIAIAREKAIEWHGEDVFENRDVIFLELLNQFMNGRDGWVKVKEIRNGLLNLAPEEWQFSDKWIGRALKRNNIILKKRRMRGGIEVMIDLKKLQDKVKRLGIEGIRNLQRERSLKKYLLWDNKKF